MRGRILVLVPLVAGCAAATSAPPSPPAPGRERPIPYPVLESPAFGDAVTRGTRTRTGRPGPAYWQNYAAYRLEATLDTAARRLSGRGTVRYENRSPDTLRVVFFHLYQDLFAPHGLRNEPVPITEGMQLTRVVAQGRELAEADRGPGYARFGTVLRVALPAPLLPGDSAAFAFGWHYTVNPDGGPRGGTDGEVWYVAYWYPQVAVYDDSRRWHTDLYLGNSEFYMGYADYDVALTVPEGFLVAATGELANAADVLEPAVRDRLARAWRSRAPVAVVGEAERGAGRATRRGQDGMLTWRFRARNVRDFAFGASPHYRWDAAAAVVGDRDGDGRPDTALAQSLWRPERGAWAWDQSARYAQHSVEFLSRFLWPYPYPHMTAVDGVRSCGGMEYPMMTCIGGRRDTLSLYSVTVHEIAHMWFPMQVGSDEKRYAWQDEGLTRFNQGEAMAEFFPGFDIYATQVRPGYLRLARAGEEVELMRHGDLYPAGTPAYGVASYSKTALNLRSLRALLGDSVFLAAYREYGRRWMSRHPTPYDFFNTFEDVAGRDLDWFWRTWWYETWPLDQAIAAVVREGDVLVVTIEDRGLAPMPVRLAIRRDGGAERVAGGAEGGAEATVEWVEVPVDVWLSGARRTVVRVPHAATVAALEIDPEEAFPDVDRSNQRARRGAW
jgi:hypothetical protein